MDRAKTLRRQGISSSISFVIVDQALAAILESAHAKVHQQAYWQVHQAQICDHLFGMNRRVSLGRFDLDQQLVFDKQIEAESIVYHDALVLNPHETLPLHVQLQYEDYQAAAAFASASLLAMIALLTLLLKAFIEWRQERSLKIEAEKERQVTQ